MTEAQVIEGLFLALVAALPQVATEIEAVFAAFKASHPDIGAAPPAPEKAAIDAAIDAELAARAAGAPPVVK